MTVDQLGNVQPETRTPVPVASMETLGKNENRCSGIPTIRFAKEKLSLPSPVFPDSRGSFRVTLYNAVGSENTITQGTNETVRKIDDIHNLIGFCSSPGTREEIIAYWGLPSGQYALRHYLYPLAKSGAIQMTMPDKPRSPVKNILKIRQSSPNKIDFSDKSIYNTSKSKIH